MGVRGRGRGTGWSARRSALLMCSPWSPVAAPGAVACAPGYRSPPFLSPPLPASSFQGQQGGETPSSPHQLRRRPLFHDPSACNTTTRSASRAVERRWATVTTAPPPSAMKARSPDGTPPRWRYRWLPWLHPAAAPAGPHEARDSDSSWRCPPERWVPSPRLLLLSTVS